MKTYFPKKENYKPRYYLIDAKEKCLGRLATKISLLLRSKESSLYSPGVDQGNYVVILNANKIKVSGKKEEQKIYYRNNQRPGSLKMESFEKLKNRIPSRILEKAIWGMLPKGVLGRNYFRRLYVYSVNDLVEIEDANLAKVNFERIEI